MSRVFPEMAVLLDGEPIGGLDLKHTDFHVSIHATRAMSFGKVFYKNTRYQLKLNNGGVANSYFVKDFCKICGTDHYVIKDIGSYHMSGYVFDDQEAEDTLNVKLLRDSTPYALALDIFIYNDLKFICM